MSLIEVLKNEKKRFDRSVDRSVELGFGFCFQQNAYGGVGLWLRDAGRGPPDRASSPESRDIAVIGKAAWGADVKLYFNVDIPFRHYLN